jgi:SNF2 family DNA or RNA helicase
MDYKTKLEPKKHQKIGVEKMMEGNIANFDDQGMGKCKQAYDTAGKLFENEEIDLMIMISKSSLRYNFYAEVAKDAYQLSPLVVSGSPKERLKTYKNICHNVLIVSFETVVSDFEYFKEIFKKNKVLFCIDEAHYIKNPKALRTQRCLELSPLAYRCTIFTGTPAPNGYKDLFTQFKFLGYDVGENLDDFKKKYRTDEEFKKFISNKMIRRTKGEIEGTVIPPKRVTIHRLDMSDTEERVYTSALKKFRIKFEDSLNRLTKIEITHALTQLIRLNQLASNPRVIIPGYDGKRTKIDALDSMVEDLIKKGEKVIIWTGYKRNVKELVDKYSCYNAVTLTGGLGKDTLSSNAETFQKNPSCKVLIATPQCAREGFTLTSSSTAIYLDRSYSLLDWVQSQDRIHRMGQTKECNIHVLHLNNTLDEKLEEILNTKDVSQKNILGDIDNANVRNLTLDLMRDILYNKADKP